MSVESPPEAPATEVALESAEAPAVIDAEPAVREHPSKDPIDALAELVGNIDWSALALPQIATQEHQQDLALIGSRMEKVDGLIDRLTQLPLVAAPEQLAAELTELGSTDIRACLRRITRACKELGAPDLSWESDTEGWIELLDVTIRQLERRGAPEVNVLSGPAGDLEGPRPHRPIENLTVRDSRAITYGVGNTLHVVHHCAVERPVVEVASLLAYDDATDTETWLHSVEAVRAAGTEDMQTRITRSSGISVGVGNHQRSVFTHQIGSCAGDLGVLVAKPVVRQAILAYRKSGGTAEAMAALTEVVGRVVRSVDVSALVPDSMVLRLAADQERAPSLRGRGPTLTVQHGAGVAVGWDARITRETRIKVGKPTVK